MNNANPIQQELEKLDEQWEDFTSSKLPLFTGISPLMTFNSA
jgi:hypothetical protein